MTSQSDHTNKSLFEIQIEPSIREGEVLVPSSLTWKFDERPALVKDRFPPANTTPPVISGPTLIPGILSCDPGQWLGSPGVQYQFQWMSGGVDIPGAIQQTWTSSDEYSDTVITCEVRGFNPLGEDYAISNSLLISSIYPIELREEEFYITTGLRVDEQLVNLTIRSMIITGIGDNYDPLLPGNLTSMRAVAYTTTGLAALGRFDMAAMSTSVLTGISIKDTLTVYNGPEVAVISRDTGQPLQLGIPQYFKIINPYGEMSMGGWVNQSNVTTINVNNDAPEQNIDPEYVNTYNTFMGGFVEDPPYQFAYQDVPVKPAWEPTIDGGTTTVKLTWWQESPSSADMANMRVEYYDGSMQILGTNDGPGLVAYNANAGWVQREIEDSLPPNTRFVRIIMEFFFNSGVNIDSRIDGINMQIWTGDLQTSREFGPLFPAWRIRFTQARTWPGCALSELEMRNVIGGTDLTTPDTNRIIGGSNALGGDKNFAFDNLRNTGYWAGDILGISEGTSWLGYEFPINLKPGELDITARSGSNALQMGQSFLLEGRHANGVWYKVQNFDNIPEFEPGERKQFVVANGAVPYIRNSIQSASYNQGWNRNIKGTVYKSKTRLDLTHVAVRFPFLGFNFQVVVGKISYAYETRDGAVVEIYTDQIHQSTVNADWDEIALPSPVSVEVDEEFCVLIRDIDQATNAACRIYHFDGPPTYNVGYQFMMSDNLYVKKINNFYLSWADPIEVGLTGNDPRNTPFWAIDLRGTIF